MRRRTILAIGWLAVGGAIAASAGGCSTGADNPTDADTTTARNVEIRLLVVDDPALAAAIDRVAGEWKARSGGTIAIDQATSAELVGGDALPHAPDAVIYPAALLGTLAVRQWIAPLPDDYSQNRELAWSDTFELLQVAEARWQQTPLAVPLGSPVFTCYYRADLLEKFHRRPPETWREYQELAAFFAQRDKLGDAAPPADADWVGCAEPLAPGWAGRLLLARAAAYVKHRDNYSTLFDIDSMDSLVGTAGYVRALEELVAAAQLGPDDPQALDPAAAREAFLQGHCALALAWPGHQQQTAAPRDAVPAGDRPPVGFAELPGSRAVYNFALGSWENRQRDENIHATLLGASGRLASLSADAAHPHEAFSFLAWLSGKNWGGKIGSLSSASPATTLYRGAQLRAPQPWVDPGTDIDAARAYADRVSDALSRPTYLFAVRIPGHDRYLAALDAAVADALGGETTAADALAKAAAEWNAITDEVGRDTQRKAYRASLGLEP